MSGQAFRRREPDERVGPDADLALWVHVDLTGRADFGGRLNPAETVTTLRFLADQVEAGDVKLGAEQSYR